jgi:hypothetical protein
MSGARMRRAGWIPAIVAAAGCAATGPVSVSTSPDPATLWGAKVHRTAFEDPTASQPAPAPVAGPTPKTDDPVDTDAKQRQRNGMFWGGIATTSVGGALLLATGIGGRVTQAQLQNRYEDSDLTYAEEDKLRKRGDVFNALAITGATLALAGAALAIVTYGVDYGKCGTLSKKRRPDCRNKSDR